MKNIGFFSRYFFLFLFCCSLVACKYDIYQAFFRGPAIDERASSIIEMESPTLHQKGEISFAIITDLHYGSKKDRSETQVIKSLAECKPLDFVVVLGDVVETGFDEYFRECEDFIGRLKGYLETPDLPIYVVLGNHDLYYNGLGRWEKLNFSRNKAATFFRFETTGIVDGKSYPRSWYFLDTASGVVGRSQMEALSDAMKADKNPKIVFTHYPVYVDKGFSTPFKLSDPRERAKLLTLFDKNKVDMIFSGHWHEGGSFNYGRFSELCCASFVENSDDQSNWFVLSLSESSDSLQVNHYKSQGGNLSASTQMYSLKGRK